MTTNPAARAVLDNAQATLEQAQADLTTFDGFLPWLQQAVARVRDLEKFSLGPGPEHLATILAADERAVTPPSRTRMPSGRSLPSGTTASGGSCVS